MRGPSGDALARRIAGYMVRLPRLSAGEGRHQVGFRFAAWLTHDLALSDVAALPWLEAWNAGNSPPRGESELQEVLRCGREYGQSPVGAGLLPLTPRSRRRKDHHSKKVITFTVRGGD